MGRAELVLYDESDGEMVEAEFRVVMPGQAGVALRQLGRLVAVFGVLAVGFAVLEALGVARDVALVGVAGCLLVAELVIFGADGGFEPATRPWREW